MKQYLGICLACVCLSCGGSPETKRPAVPVAKAAKSKPRPKVKRSLSASEVQSKMREQVASMAACYELSPAKAKEVAGELTVEFTVEANGQVSGESLVSDSIEDKVLQDCVLGVVRKTAFPTSGAATDVSWPLHFGAR